MVLGLDDIKFVDMTFIKAAYVKYHITGHMTDEFDYMLH